MKNFKTLLVVLASVTLVFASVEVDAQNGNGNGKKGKMNNFRAQKHLQADSTCDSARNRNFVDEDSDGLCDNAKTRQNQPQSFVDANNDGVCDNQANCQNFVDANNDGVCDNKGTGRKGKSMKNGKGKGNCSGDCQNNQTTILNTFASPNPFTSSTIISFETKVEGNGSVILYDMSGNLIKKIYEGNFTVGTHTYTYNAENLTPGRYIFKIQQNNIIKSIPVVYSN